MSGNYFSGDGSISRMVRNALSRNGSSAGTSSGFVPSSSSRPVVEPRVSQRQVASIRQSAGRSSSVSSSGVSSSKIRAGASNSVISPRQPSSQVTPRLIQVSAKEVSAPESARLPHTMQSLPTLTGKCNSSSSSSSGSHGLSGMFNSMRIYNGRENGDMKGGGSAISSRAAELQYSRRGGHVVSYDNPVLGAQTGKAVATGSAPVAAISSGSADGKPVVCDKCDGKHPTDSCPYFKKARENHADATSRGKGLGSATSPLPGATLKNAKVVRQPGDGSCLFHSMAYGLREGSANSLRAEICQFIVSNPSMKISDTPISDWVRWDSGTSVGDYAKRMSRGAWGKVFVSLFYSIPVIVV
jgi:hypothetical protein